MSTSFTVIYESVLSKIKDYQLADLEEEDVYSILSDYLRPAIVSFRICKQDLTDRDSESFACNLITLDSCGNGNFKDSSKLFVVFIVKNLSSLLLVFIFLYF